MNQKPNEKAIWIGGIDDIIPLLSESERNEVVRMIEEIEKYKSEYNRKLVEDKAIGHLNSKKSSVLDEIDNSIKKLEDQLISLNIEPMTKENVTELFNKNNDKIVGTMVEPTIPSDTNYVHFYPVRSTYTYKGTSYEVLEIIATCSGYKNTTIEVPFQIYETFVMFPADSYTQSDFGKVLEFASSLGEVVVPSAYEKVPLLNYVAEVWNLATYFNSTHDQVVDGLLRARQTMSYAYVREPGTNWYTHMQSSEQQTGYYTFTFGLSNGTGKSVTVNFNIKSDYFADVKNPVINYYSGDLTLEKYKCGSMKIKYNGSTRKTFSMHYYSEVGNIPGV